MPPSLTPEQEALADCMSETFKAGFHDTWIEGLEELMWQAAFGKRGWFGSINLGDDSGEGLRHLSVACGGWIVSDPSSGLRWVPEVEWREAIARSDRAAASSHARHVLRVQAFAAVVRLGPAVSEVLHECVWRRPPPSGAAWLRAWFYESVGRDLRSVPYPNP